MNDLIFLDTETTGLEPEKHEVWEIAYAVNEGPVETFWLSHSLLTADTKALELNGYMRRQNPSMVLKSDQELAYVREKLNGATIVAANPTYDRMMLRARWSMEPWHHRSVDIETMAMTVFNADRPLSMKNIVDSLLMHGYEVPQPDHTAKNDVIALRTSYHALRDMQRKYVETYFKRPY